MRLYFPSHVITILIRKRKYFSMKLGGQENNKKRKSTNFVVEEGKGESENLATQAHTGTLLEHPLG